MISQRAQGRRGQLGAIANEVQPEEDIAGRGRDRPVLARLLRRQAEQACQEGARVNVFAIGGQADGFDAKSARRLEQEFGEQAIDHALHPGAEIFLGKFGNVDEQLPTPLRLTRSRRRKADAQA